VLAHTLTFSPDYDDGFFLQIPAAPAVFLLRGEGEPYVSKTASLRRRLQRLLGRPAEQSKQLNLRERVREVQFTPTGSDFESQFLLYKLLRKNFAKSYAARLRLRPAPLVKLHLENEYPRASVTTRLGKLVCGQQPSAVRSSEAPDPEDLKQETVLKSEDSLVRLLPPHGHNIYYGPFASRVAAEKFASDALDFFKMRRCVDDLHPDPAFPGCVYSEMKMCLAPCFKGCTDEAYFAETQRVEAFIGSRGESLIREIAAEREAASADLEFEKAAALHSKVEKIKDVAHEADEIVRRVDQLDAVIVQPALEEERVALFGYHRGMITGPAEFSVLGMALANPGSGQSSLHTQPMMLEPVPLETSTSAEPPAPTSKPETRLREAVERLKTDTKHSVTEQMENLALLKGWYYRGTRVGEIFFCEKGEWPWRRMLNGVSRVYVGAHNNTNTEAKP